MFEALLAPICTLIDRIVPDEKGRQEIKLRFFQEEGKQALEEAGAEMAVLLQEAKSEDPWTSRARPFFLYVIYILILTSLPMAVLYAFRPELARDIIDGFHAWLAAIPSDMLQLFGVGYLGYAGARSFDKIGARAKK